MKKVHFEIYHIRKETYFTEKQKKKDSEQDPPVYKLKENQYNYNILSGSSKFVDLCAAPGSWNQMLRILTKSNKNSKIVSVDIQDIVPIEGVNIIKGDITRQDTIEKYYLILIMKK